MICEHIHGKIVQKNSRFKSFCILVQKLFCLATLCYADEEMYIQVTDGIKSENLIEWLLDASM